MRRGDAAAGGLAVLLGTATYAYTLTFPPMAEGHPGPALFPRLLSALLVLFGALLAWQARQPVPSGADDGRLPARESEAETAGEPPVADRPRWLDFGLVVAAVIFYVLAVERIGFPITMGLVNLGLMRRLGAGWTVSVFAAALMGIGLYVMFARLLLVPLPLGPFGR